MFCYSQNDLYCEQVALADLAHRTGTPAYVYSSQAILANYRAYDEAFADLPHSVCYAVKANSSLAILGLLAKAGAGFDIVSGGELFRVLQAGGDPSKVVFSGVGKTADEVEYALASGIHSFNCESESELALIDAMAARRGVKAGFSIRVNPDVDASTHPYISTGLSQHKFGIAMSQALAVYKRARGLKNLSAEGVSCHIGSQILDPAPILEAVDKLLALVAALGAEGRPIRHLDLGGGLGIAYHAGEKAPAIREFIGSLRARLGESGLRVMVEPGRSIVGLAGVLLTRVLYRKKNGPKEFVVVDAAMNDLIRPSLSRPPRDHSGAQECASAADRGRGGSHLRDRRFPGARPATGQRHARRFPGGLRGRGLRFRAFLELQLASARGGSAGGRRRLSRDSPARNLRGPGARRDGVTSVTNLD